MDIFIRDKLTVGELKKKEEEGFYPPKFRLFFCCSEMDPTLSGGKIQFEGTTCDPEFNVRLDTDTRM